MPYLAFNQPIPLRTNQVSVPSYITYNPPRITSRRPPCMATSPGRASLYGGIAVLTAVLTNRLVFTPLDNLAVTQSRSDILGVIAGATLVLYGVGKAEIADSKKAVELVGVDLRVGFEKSDLLATEIQWAAAALCKGVPNVRSVAVLVDGVGKYFYGRFRNEQVTARVVEDGIVAGALQRGERVYLGDMKVVPVKEIEFAFLPTNCQVCLSWFVLTARKLIPCNF